MTLWPAALDHFLALEKTYRRERDRLWRMALRMTGTSATAEDLVQDAFLRMMGMPAGRIAVERAWLTRVVRNLALNHLRRHGYGLFTPLDQQQIEAICSDCPTVESALIAKETLQRTLRAILALPPRRREVFILHRFHDLTYDEIAMRMGISRNTVMVQIVNALVDLHRAIGDGDPER